MDYSFFDGLIDCVFVVNAERGVLYCNEAAAKLCDSSVRRLAKGKPIFETIEFSDPSLFVMPEGSVGKDAPAPYVELKFKLKAGKEGKVQIAIQPFAEPSGDPRWVIMLRDVTLEEVLHAKYHKQLEEKEVYIAQLQEAQKKLEDYSKNLEQMVEARTQEVKRANLMLNAIMNSLGQGFFVFDQKGLCSNFYTKACEDILECVPSQKNVSEVLKVLPSEAETFNMWLSAVYGEQLPFETIKELGPNQFKHSQDRHIMLDYFALRNDESKISNVVVVATDQTSEYLANLALEKEKKYVRMVTKLVTGKKQFAQFIESAKNTIQTVKQNILNNIVSIDHEEIFRALHTLEGEAGTYFAADIWASSRTAQEVIEPLKKKQQVDIQDVRTRLLKAIDDLQATYAQFLEANQNLFSAVGMSGESKIEVSQKDIEGILSRLQKLGVTQAVYNEISDALLRESVEGAFRHYQDVVSMVAEKLSKKVAPLELTGMQTKLYLSRYVEIFASLVHAYRNAVDHGIEPSEEREMCGKPAAGKIATHVEKFENKGSWVRIKIVDDGGGISVERLKAKLTTSMGAEKVATLSEHDIKQAVFDSGVSTKEAIGEFSGRGIGMNAIKIEAERLGGRAWVESEMGQGTQLIIEVPDLERVAPAVKAA